MLHFRFIILCVTFFVLYKFHFMSNFSYLTSRILCYFLVFNFLQFSPSIIGEKRVALTPESASLLLKVAPSYILFSLFCILCSHHFLFRINIVFCFILPPFFYFPRFLSCVINAFFLNYHLFHILFIFYLLLFIFYLILLMSYLLSFLSSYILCFKR
jgi:hypothetical protein